MVADDIDRLARTVSTLDTCLKSNAVVNNVNIYERERSLCAEIRHQLSTSDINHLLKGNKQIVDRLLDQSFALLFELVGNPRYEDLRTYAEESIDAISRNFLPLNSTRVINNLISELNRAVHPKSVAGAFKRLTSVIHLANYTRIRRFAVHILTVIPKILAMNADNIFNSLINHAPLLFKTVFTKVKFREDIGPWENIYACLCDKHLKQTGLPQKCAVLLLSELSKYFESVARRVYINCVMVLANPSDPSDISKTTNYICCLQILKNLWNTVLNRFDDLDNYLTAMLRGLLLSLYTENAEVLVSTIQLLSTIFSSRLKRIYFFDPSESASPPAMENSETSSGSTSTEQTAKQTDPNNIKDSFTEEHDDIGDPLMQPELYEKSITNNKTEEISKIIQDSNKSLPLGICSEPVNFSRYTAALLASRFLLTGVTLKNQREVRVSHKILAINCLTAISEQENISDVVVHIGINTQPLVECSRFVLHEDPSLSSAAVLLIFGLAKYNVELKINFLDHILHSDNTAVKFSLITASINNQKLLQSYRCLESVIALACKEVRSSYIPLKIVCAEFLSSIVWFKLPNAVKHLQEMCLNSYFELLSDANTSVTDATISYFNRLVLNSDFSELHHLFIGNSLLEPYVLSHTLPPVLGVPSCFKFCSIRSDIGVCHNLEYILKCWIKHFSLIHDGSIKIWFIAFLEEVVTSFPVSCYYDAFNFVTDQHCGLLSWVIDIAATSSSSTEKLAAAVRLTGKLFAGESEYKLMNSNETSVNDVDTERLLLILLRIINMYYSLVLKRQSTLSQSSTNILSRATLSPAHSKKSVNNRLADISRFMGVNVTPSKPSSFYSSEDLVRLLPSIEGAYDNFLNDPSEDVSEKFLNLLNSSMFTLGVLCETFDLNYIQPLLPELCLYLKMLIDISPIHCTSLIHQLLKIVFSKNLKNARIRLLLSNFDNKENDCLSKYLNQINCYFNRYVSLMLHPEQYEEYLDRDLLWIKDDSFLPNTNNSREVAESLNLFNGLVTKLRQIYIPYESVICRKIILNILCELLRGGVKYKLIDPQNTLKETIIAQVRDSYCSNKDLAKEMALYFVFLSRFERTPNLADLEQLVIDHLRVISSDSFSAGLEFLRMIVLDFLFVRSKANKLINFALSSLFAKVDEHLHSMLRNTMDESLHLLTLRLQGTRNDEETFKSISKQYWTAFSRCWFNKDLSTNFSSAIIDFTLSLHHETREKIADEIQHFFTSNFESDDFSTSEVVQKVTPFVAFLLCTSDSDNQSLSDLLLSCDKTTVAEKLFNQQTTNYFLLAKIYYNQKTNKTGNHEQYLKLVFNFIGNIDFDNFSWIDEPSTAYLLSKLCVLLGSTRLEECLERQSDGNHLRPLLDLFTNMDLRPGTIEWNNDTEKIEPEQCLDTANISSIFQTDVFKSESSIFAISALHSMDIYLTRITKNAPEYEKMLLLAQGQINKIMHILSECFALETVELYLTFLTQLRKMCHADDIIFENPMSSKDAALFLNLVTDFMVQNEEVSHFCVSGLTCWFQTSAVEYMFSKSADPELLFSFRNFITTIVQETDLISHSIANPVPTNQLEFEGFENIPNSYRPYAGGAEGVIADIYHSIQRLAVYLRYHGNDQLDLMSLFRSMIRNPLLNQMALIPTGLKESVKVKWSTKDEITFPLIQIHNLCNVDVLMDFSWRINWLGWLTKKQYEEFWMSLLGVLSSTPSGSELTNLDGLSMAEQILYSGAAVTCITDILIYTRLFPQPGNVENGTFAVKHREQNNALYKSKIFKQMQHTEARLLKDASPSTAFLCNLEKQKYQGHNYELNQLSALSLWTLCGEIKSTKLIEAVSERIKPSLSLFLLEATEELDVASSVNALFLNYSHWFEKGIESVPQPLLSATIRSMALLSDLFDNLEFYRTLYVQLKNVFDGGYFSDHIDLGYVIYGLLKAVTIIGVDTFGEGSDVDKMVLSWVESGLTSTAYFVREATLQGYSYLLQSMNFEIVRSSCQYINGFLLSELETFHPVVVAKQPKPTSFHSTNYFNLVWSISFRCMQQPMQLKFAEDVLSVVRRCFTNRDTAKSHMDLITCGIQNLMLHSTSFTEMNKIEDLYRDIFIGYSRKGYRFIHALRIFHIAVFTGGLLASDDNKAIYFHEDMEKLVSIYKRTETHAKPISLVLVPLLNFLYTEEVVFKKLLDFCIPPAGGLPNHLGYSLTMLSEFIMRFRSTGQSSSVDFFAEKCLEVAKDLLNRKTEEDDMLALSIIMASNKDSQIVDRLPDFIERIYTKRISRDELNWLKDYLL